MRVFTLRAIRIRAIHCPCKLLTLGLAVIAISLALHTHRVAAQNKQTTGLARPLRLDEGISWKRDPATGELFLVHSNAGREPGASESAAASHSISVVTQVVPVTCSVVGPDGVAIQNLQQKDFRVFDDGSQRPIVYFDASSLPANVALVIDASPSVLRESDEMKNAARALVDA